MPYADVQVVPVSGSEKFEIQIDGQTLLTPAQHGLRFVSEELANAVALEWQIQDNKKRPSRDTYILPETCPLTCLVFTEIDRVSLRPESFVVEIMNYFNSELVCFRVPEPEDLVMRQSNAWDPVLDWLERRYGVRLEVSQNLLSESCSHDSRERLETIVTGFTGAGLTALQDLTSSLGSATLALAVLDGHVSVGGAYDLADLERIYQAEIWGWDPDVEAARAHKKMDLEHTFRYAQLSGVFPSRLSSFEVKTA